MDYQAGKRWFFWRSDNATSEKINHKNRFNSTHFENKDMCTALKASKRASGKRWMGGGEPGMSMGPIFEHWPNCKLFFSFCHFHRERHAGVKASLRIYFWLFLCVRFFYLAATMAAAEATVLFSDLFLELFFVPPKLQSGSFTSACFFFSAALLWHLTSFQAYWHVGVNVI